MAESVAATATADAVFGEEANADPTHLPQAVYVAFGESGETIAFEASLKNEVVRRLIAGAP